MVGEIPTPQKFIYTYMSEPIQARTKFILPSELVEGTITDITIDAEPFHCVIKITPTDPTVIAAEGRYSANELSLSKLRRNLIHLQFPIKNLEDILAAVESLEHRMCTFRIDKSGWISWITKLLPMPKILPDPVSTPLTSVTGDEWELLEIFLTHMKGHRSIYEMKDRNGKIVAYAVGPSGVGPNPHGWILSLPTLEAAQEVLAKRKL
jgi:hypothetical protein